MKNLLFSKIKAYKNEILAVVLMLLFIMTASVRIDIRFLYIGFLLIAVYVLLLVAFHFSGKKKVADKNLKDMILNNVSAEFLMNLDTPVAILDDDGVILWYNQKFAEDKAATSLFGTSINDLLETKLNLNHLKESLSEKHADAPLYASLSGVKYKVISYRHGISTGGENFYITVWYDMSEIKKLEETVMLRNPVVMYVYIDNFYDAGGAMVNNYRTVTANISSTVYEWMSAYNGIVKEIERDKYIAVFDREYLFEIMENKFDLLDRTRALCEKETDTLVTLSIGVACLENATLAEKEKAAHQAIDLAMQRGGDQAVVKFDESSEFYGGKFKSVQKRTKIRSRQKAQDLIKYIVNASNVLIMGHKFADYDSIGSCVGIAKLALEYNSKVNIIVNREDSNFKRLYDGKISSLDKYSNIFVDAYEGQDLINEATFLIVCDVNNPSIFEAKDVYENVRDFAVIDHHRKSGEFFADPCVNYIDPSASSASELVSEILELVTQPGALMQEEAELLLAGMALDTKQFTKNTGVRTFSAALYLRSEGANTADINSLFKPSFDEFSREGKFTNNTMIYRDSFAICKLDDEASADDKISAARVADKLIDIDGVKASFALCKIGNTVHISSRSNSSVNVQKILEGMNGGGHFDSAGAQVIDMTLDAVVTLLKKEIDNYLGGKEN